VRGFRLFWVLDTLAICWLMRSSKGNAVFGDESAPLQNRQSAWQLAEFDLLLSVRISEPPAAKQRLLPLGLTVRQARRGYERPSVLMS